jgi:hypothetical protein
MTTTDERQRVDWLETMYVRFVIAFGVLVCAAVLAALYLLDHVRLLDGNWADESTGVTVLLLVTFTSIVGAAACGVAAFVARALTAGVRP